jgi:hypothetical protein
MAAVYCLRPPESTDWSVDVDAFHEADQFELSVWAAGASSGRASEYRIGRRTRYLHGRWRMKSLGDGGA